MKPIIVLCAALALAACGGDRPLASDGFGGSIPEHTLGSVGSWLLVAGGAALAIATVAYVLLWTPIGRLAAGIPGLSGIIVGVEAAGGALIVVGSALEWLDAHRWALLLVVALVGVLVAVRHRRFLLRWLRVGQSKTESVTHAG